MTKKMGPGHGTKEGGMILDEKQRRPPILRKHDTDMVVRTRELRMSVNFFVVLSIFCKSVCSGYGFSRRQKKVEDGRHRIRPTPIGSLVLKRNIYRTMLITR